MSAINSRQARPQRIRKPRQDGAAAVEFAVVALVFFTVVLGIIEFARVMYMYNTLAEVTRSVARDAANLSFTDGNGLTLARKHAVFDEAGGKLPFGSPITAENIRIEYLYLPAKADRLELIPDGTMPSCPAKNRLNCMLDPNSASCIRAVQARIFQEGQGGDKCTPVPYEPLISLIDLPLKLPTSVTIVHAETLGYKAGDLPCP
jgi:hypothetical protein